MSDYTYKDPLLRARLAIGFFLLSALLFAFSAAAFCHLAQVLNPAGSAAGAIKPAASLAQAMAYFAIAGLVPAWIFFLIWIYRAVANVHALGGDIRNSAGGAVGIFFIPLANLVMVPLMVSELRRASINALDWRTLGGTWLVPCWWTLQILVTVLGLASGGFKPAHGATVDQYVSFFWFTALLVVPDILLHCLSAFLVWRITRDQRSQWETKSMITEIF